jgi:hypothetical protein
MKSLYRCLSGYEIGPRIPVSDFFRLQGFKDKWNKTQPQVVNDWLSRHDKLLRGLENLSETGSSFTLVKEHAGAIVI